MVLGWIRFGIAAVLILVGRFVIGVAIFGVFRFNFILNRMHIAAACDTLGTLMILLGLLILEGFSTMSLKLILIVGFMWLANPISSHLICKLEIETNEKIEEECEVVE